MCRPALRRKRKACDQSASQHFPSLIQKAEIFHTCFFFFLQNSTLFDPHVQPLHITSCSFIFRVVVDPESIPGNTGNETGNTPWIGHQSVAYILTHGPFMHLARLEIYVRFLLWFGSFRRIWTWQTHQNNSANELWSGLLVVRKQSDLTDQPV